MTLSLKLTQELISWIIDDPRKEICAYLLKDQEGNQQLFRVTNYSIERDSFNVLKADYHRIKKYADKHRLVICYFIHSHRYGLELSSEDKEEFDRSNLSWVIISLQGSELLFKCYNKTKTNDTG